MLLCDYKITFKYSGIEKLVIFYIYYLQTYIEYKMNEVKDYAFGQFT